MTLLEAFSTVEDFRRGQGKRYELSQILTMIFLSYLCGHYTYRRIYTFCRVHEDVLTKELGLRHNTPSHITFHTVLNGLDEQSCIEAFNLWASSYTSGSSEGSDKDQQEKVLSTDGKSLASTVSNAHNSEQNFQSVVSIFGQKSGLVYQIASFQNKKSSEITVVEELIKSLKGKGLLLCADALHCQKKQ